MLRHRRNTSGCLRVARSTAESAVDLGETSGSVGIAVLRITRAVDPAPQPKSHE